MDGIHHIALRVSDCAASARFYAQAFGLHEIRRTEEGGLTQAVWLRAGGAVLMLERTIRGHGRPEGSGHVLVFATEDLEAAEQRLHELGIAITDRTPSTLFVQDPDGHRSGLSIYPFDQILP
jgi:catechol 2,3-dioxygenase-like lactoylglutathione lyase family enzyme